MAILHSDLPCGTMHHPTKFQAEAEIPKELERKHRPSNLDQIYHEKFQCSIEHTKISREWPFLVTISFMVLCITPPYFGPIFDIFEEQEW